MITMPTVLSFNRKLEPSDAVMHSGNWGDIGEIKKWNPVELFERRNRAVKSNFKQEVLNDEAKLQKQIAEPNLAWGDDASLPFDADTLRISFSLRIFSDINTPSACNNNDYQQKFTSIINEYISAIGLEELASRYAYNIANGRFLWRNRVGAQEVTIHVKNSSLGEQLAFNAYDYPLKNTKISDNNDSKVSRLANLIQKGLNDKENTLIEINAYVKMGKGQRVWPSQEMVLNIPKGEKSRHLFSLAGIAAMHCEKIGNALRTIDDWQAKSESPIAIEAFGSVTQRGIACRSNSNDFKTLITKWINDKNITENDKHFVVAMLIRGGVFSN